MMTPKEKKAAERRDKIKKGVKKAAHKAGGWIDKQSRKKAHNKPISRRLKKLFG